MTPPHTRSTCSFFSFVKNTSSEERDLGTFQNPSQRHPPRAALPSPPRRHFTARPRPPPPQTTWRPWAPGLGPSPLPLGKANVREPSPAWQTLPLPSTSDWSVAVQTEIRSDGLGKAWKTSGPPLCSREGREKRGHRAGDCGRPTTLEGSVTSALEAQKEALTPGLLPPASYRPGKESKPKETMLATRPRRKRSCVLRAPAAKWS